MSEYQTDVFIVQSATGQIELRSTNRATLKVLAAHADLVIYDPALELLWYVDADRLQVVDLRVEGSGPTVIVQGVPEVSHLEIRRRDTSISTQDPCQGPKFVLLWNETPSNEAYDADTTDTRINGRAWLQRELDRPARAIGATRDFAGEQIRLPKRLLDCEEPSFCATTSQFGAQGHQLVLVVDKAGGDCWSRACLLRDPHTNRFASPLDTVDWGPAAKAKRGPCGLYYFDQLQSTFLIGSRICVEGSPCQELDGQALGWLHGGVTVGAVGDTSDEE